MKLIEAAVTAYLEANFYKYSLEYKARPFQLESVCGIEYQQKMQHPWPRRFDYQLEFFAGEVSPNLVNDKIRRFIGDSPREFVLNVFTSNLNFLIPGYRDIGFQHAWNNTLMTTKLKAKKAISTLSAEIEIEQMQSVQDIATVNAMEPEFPASTRSLNDPNVINFYATYDGQVVAKAQAIIVEPSFLYISDMFTSPAFRRKGLSAALLETLHRIGLERGCQNAILVPSRMTREIELYQKFAYTELVPIALLVPPGNNQVLSGMTIV